MNLLSELKYATRQLIKTPLFTALGFAVIAIVSVFTLPASYIPTKNAVRMEPGDALRQLWSRTYYTPARVSDYRLTHLSPRTSFPIYLHCPKSATKAVPILGLVRSKTAFAEDKNDTKQ